MSEPNRPLFARRAQNLAAEEFERLDEIRVYAVGGNIFGADENALVDDLDRPCSSTAKRACSVPAFGIFGEERRFVDACFVAGTL